MIDAKAFFDYDQREMGNQLNIEEDSHFEIIPGLNTNEDQNIEEDMDNEKQKTKNKGFGKYAEVWLINW